MTLNITLAARLNREVLVEASRMRPWQRPPNFEVEGSRGRAQISSRNLNNLATDLDTKHRETRLNAWNAVGCPVRLLLAHLHL
jgi:hypothetical protein